MPGINDEVQPVPTVQPLDVSVDVDDSDMQCDLVRFGTRASCLAVLLVGGVVVLLLATGVI